MSLCMEHLLGSRSNDSDRSEFLGEREGAEDMAGEVSCISIADLTYQPTL